MATPITKDQFVASIMNILDEVSDSEEQKAALLEALAIASFK